MRYKTLLNMKKNDVSVPQRLSFISSSKYGNINARELTVEELIEIYNDIKSELPNLEYQCLKSESDLSAVLNNLIAQNIEISIMVIDDLININSPHIELHSVISKASLEFAAATETNQIFSNAKIFNWYFSEYRNSEKYKSLINKVLQLGTSKCNTYEYMIFDSLNKPILYFIDFNNNEWLYEAFKLSVMSMDIEERAIYFEYFARHSMCVLQSNVQKDIVRNAILGLPNEESIKNLLELHTVTVNGIIQQLQALNYDIINHTQEIEDLMWELVEMDEEAFVSSVLSLLKRNLESNISSVHIDYYMYTFLRRHIRNKSELILGNQEIRRFICENYKLQFDYLPIPYRKKLDPSSVSEVVYVINEMIYINIKNNLFDAYEIFKPMYMLSKQINWGYREILLKILYDLIQGGQIKNCKHLEVLFFYYLKVEKLKFFNVSSKLEIQFYNDIYADFDIFCNDFNVVFKAKEKFQNPRYVSEGWTKDNLIREYSILEDTIQRIIRIKAIEDPIVAFKLVEKAMNSKIQYSVKRSILSMFMFECIDKFIFDFELIAKYILNNKLISYIAKILEADKIDGFSKDFSNNIDAIANYNYINWLQGFLSSYIRSITKAKKSVGIHEIEFLEKLYNSIIVVFKDDDKFHYYYPDKCVAIHQDRDILDSNLIQLDVKMKELREGRN